jgi:hypothetical protein
MLDRELVKGKASKNRYGTAVWNELAYVRSHNVPKFILMRAPTGTRLNKLQKCLSRSSVEKTAAVTCHFPPHQIHPHAAMLVTAMTAPR